MRTEEEKRLLGEMLPQVASQLRGSLANLHAALDRVVPEDPATARERAILSHSYYQMLRLVNNLSAAPLLLSTDTLHTENVELREWLEELCRRAEPLVEKKSVRLVLRCPMRTHVAAIDRVWMERLVWNLLSNALKFTPSGGQVTVSLQLGSGQLLLRVRDTGCGIAPELLDTVFDRWLHTERMDPGPHGLGLGLPLCRRIAQGHGGRLLLTSEVGVGTEVTVALPDRRQEDGSVREQGFRYDGGFQPVLLELADALPYTAYTAENLD